MFHFRKENFSSMLVVVISTLAFAESAAAFVEACSGATAIDVDGSVWSAGYEESEIFHVEVKTAGILVLDIEAVLSVGSPRLMFLGRECVRSKSDRDFAVAEEGLDYQVIAIREPGTYTLKVASKASGQPLGEYELRSSFTPTEVLQEDMARDLGLGRWMLVHQTHFLVSRDSQKSEEETVDPNPNHKSEEETVDPNPNYKSEEETVDPNPNVQSPEFGRDSVLTMVTFQVVSMAKSEEETVDPNPNFRGVELASGAISGQFVIYPDLLDTEGDLQANVNDLYWLESLLATR